MANQWRSLTNILLDQLDRELQRRGHRSNLILLAAPRRADYKFGGLKPENGFEFEALLGAFDCLLDAPSLVVEVAEERGREGRRPSWWRAGATGRWAQSGAPGAPQGLGRASPVAHVIGAGGVERDPGIILPRAPERLGRTPAAVVVAAHDEADAPSDEQCHQPGGWIAAIEHQYVVGPETSPTPR